jgi:DHA2 family multidrug resistance protein
MAVGVCLLVWSLYRLSTWTPAVQEMDLIVNTMIQGAGIGLVFVPLNVVAFGTLAPRLRYEGTAMLSLMRNVGSSIGISVFEALVTRNTQIEHSVLAVFGSPLNRALQAVPQVAQALSPTTAHGAQALDQMIGYQAQVIAYANDYWLMAIMSAPIMALLFLMRKPKQGQAGGSAVVD